MSRAYAGWHKLLIVFCLGLLIFFVSSDMLMQQVLPVSGAESNLVLVEIPQGASSGNIAETLKQAGVVRNNLAFRVYAKFKGYDGRLKAGEYEFYTAMNMDEILEKLYQGDVIQSYTRITLPEGFRVEQVAARLEAQGVVEEEVFLELLLEKQFDYWFLKDITQSTYPVEGYLFPDTYYLEDDDAEEEIIHRMLRQFEGVFNDTYQQRAEELGMTVHEVVTLASIIEREARLKEERPIISGVFHNRLQRNMLLQSCATVQYALGEIKPKLSTRDTEIDSPYNTYLHTGLPPGPIASPGRDAIHAALYPEETDNLYFVLRGDNSGGHYFSRTLQEHLENQRKAVRERDS
ncbi:endolytic transglycosylase MltG [Candidatus Contubernalis alkaliaceticus]|uniref:endolytic transglycosylase MltG n=1 Tax=Candidatus Contubernalis alkaliaceticus TaxID=338645 RepID=UPI001F4BF477|nr:endolytic transglycosylase MltG [Candidatus Contubernalis alkalaceticus]UNC92587.1 endolytic transglycosylase MltG [Candidatus Contubernalis alkalaceticus]